MLANCRAAAGLGGTPSLRGGLALVEVLAPLLGADTQLPGCGCCPTGIRRNPAESSGIQHAARRLLPHEPAPPGVPHTCVSCSLSGIIWTNYVEMENVLTSGSAIPLL